MSENTPNSTNSSSAPRHAATAIMHLFYDMHPQDPLVTTFDSALKSGNNIEISKATNHIFTRFPTNPIRANALYKQLNANNPTIAAEILNCYQSGKYAEQLAQGLEDKIANIQAQMELDEAEISSIRAKIVKNLEPEQKACEARIGKLQDQIEQQRDIVKALQEKVDAVAQRLTTTKKNLHDAIFEQTRLDKEIALSLENNGNEDEDEDGKSSGSGDTGGLKKQKSGQERIAQLIQEEIAHLDINQKAVNRELENAKQQLSTLEDLLANEVITRDDIAKEIEAHKTLIKEIEAQNSSNAEEIAKLEIDREFIQSAMFTETFNALSSDIPMHNEQEEKLSRFIEENAKSETLLSAADEAHFDFLSEQEKQNIEQKQQTELTENVTESAEESAENSESTETEIHETLTLERDLAMEAATDNAIRMVMTMEAGGMIPESDFDALMDALPADLRNKVEPAVEERLNQKGITIEKDNGFTPISEATPQIFDPASRGPRGEINPSSPTNPRGNNLRMAFVDSDAFKKFNAEGIEASYDTKPIKGIDPTIFQKGLNNSNFEPALENKGPAPEQPTPEQKKKPAPNAQIKPLQPGQSM